MTMLQFGSFETKAEAEKRLSEVTAKHKAKIGSLATAVREVKLPPDNLTVYRTQAGPVENRAAAQAICSQLTSAGDECYIVQTAMVAEGDLTKPTQMAAAESKPTAPMVAPSVVEEVKKELPAPASDAPDLTRRLSSLNDAPAAASVSLSSEPVSVPTVTEPSPALQSALDKAVAEQGKTEEVVAAATTSKPAQAKPSFWQRINPFSKKPKPEPEVVKAVEDPRAAPIDAVIASSMDAPVPAVVQAPAVEMPAVVVDTPKLEVAQVEVPKTDKIETPKIEAPMVAARVETPVVVVPTVEKPQPVMMVSRPVITSFEPMILPPPPAPLKARDRAMLEQAKLERPVPPVATGEIASVNNLPPVGDVRVEEAKRVPVTEGSEPTMVTAASAPAAPAVSLRPTSTDGQKTLWAQIGPFVSSDAALAFWANYRQSHPDFPVVRVRVTSPVMQQTRGGTESWLRVGPVMRSGFVRSLCGSLAPTSQLRCGTVVDKTLPATGLKK
jgi:hypothetical protein